jgi:NADPH:quinone reductase-like Zn-dependent oxidoreductase
MKAAVLYKAGVTPKYADFAEPIPQAGEQLIQVKAASIKNLDKMQALGTHYHKHANFPAVVGVDGVGILANGTRVYTGSRTGMMAEKAIANDKMMVTVPDNVDDITAAALPNPGMSAWLSLVWKGQLQKGNSVLIVGATGTTGNMAVQIAKYFGAGRIVVMGRNANSLEQLKSLGADATISLKQTDDEIVAAVKFEAQQHPFDIVIDYLWGKPAELVLTALTGNNLNTVSKLVRYIHVGEMAGSTINLPGAVLRSSQIEISGVGGGGVPKEVMAQFPQVLGQLYQMAAEGKLVIKTEAVALKDIEAAWERGDLDGKRLVVIP